MNERIRQLEKQCWSHRVDGALVDGHLHFDTQRFAELIVKECVKCSDLLVSHYINTHTENEQALLLAAIADYTGEIKQHFGVEE